MKLSFSKFAQWARPRPEVLRAWRNSEAMMAQMELRGFQVPRKYLDLSASASGFIDNWSSIRYQKSDDMVQGWPFNKQHSEAAEKESLGLARIAEAPEMKDARRIVEEWKLAEARISKSIAGDWVPAKASIRKFAQALAIDRGHVCTKTGFVVRINGDWVLDTSVDIGRPGSTLQEIVLLSEMRTNSGTSLAPIGLNSIVPGMECYNYDRNPDLLVWGVQAYIELAEVFSSFVRQEANLGAKP